MFRYDSADDAQMQLDYTLQMTASGLAYVRHQRGWRYSVNYLDKPNLDPVEGDIRKVGLTFEPLELGYVNYFGSLLYLVRKPLRAWKQGISMDNLRNLTEDYRHPPEDVLESSNIRDTIENKYYNLTRSYDEASKKGNNCAFHRDFALRRAMLGQEITLEYKGSKVGIVNKDLDFEIDDKYIYIKEALEEAIHENG